MQITETEIIKINGVYFTLIPVPSIGQICIERIYVEPQDRGRKLCGPAFQALCEEADEQGRIYYALLLPDDNKPESYDQLRHIFAKAGFEPETIDGETYRNDLVRYPKK